MSVANVIAACAINSAASKANDCVTNEALNEPLTDGHKDPLYVTVLAVLKFSEFKYVKLNTYESYDPNKYVEYSTVTVPEQTCLIVTNVKFDPSYRNKYTISKLEQKAAEYAVKVGWLKSEVQNILDKRKSDLSGEDESVINKALQFDIDISTDASSVFDTKRLERIKNEHLLVYNEIEVI
jgi:hypothetical protein